MLMLRVIHPQPFTDLLKTPDKRKVFAFINKQKGPFLIQDVLRFCHEKNMQLKPMTIQNFLLALGRRGFLKRTRTKLHPRRGASHVVYERANTPERAPT